jgi:hypothetical protein
MSFTDQKRGIESHFKSGLHTSALVYETVALTVNAVTKKISRSAGSFITDGVTSGSFIGFEGFTNTGNNQIFKVSAVAAGVVTVEDPNSILVNETGTITSYSFPAIPISFENIPFEPPEDAIFVTVHIMEGDGVQITCGIDLPVSRYIGIVQNSIIGPSGIGTDPYRLVADRIKEIWKRAQFTYGNSGQFIFGISKLEPEWRAYAMLGARGALYRLDVTTPYHRDIQD